MAELDAEKRAKSAISPRRRFVVGGLVILFIATAIGLGVGLGVGLADRKNKSTMNSNSGSNSRASPVVQSWRRSTEDYNLDIANWDLNAPPTTRSYNFTVGEITIAPDGVSRTVLAINGQYPGPLIRLNRGDTLLVNLTNNLPNATTLHWHGMFQNGTNWMDGTTGITQCPVPPGQSFMYNFTVENQFGTYWYHAHFSTQYVDGIVGPLIIHAPEESETRKLYDFDQVVLMQDWYHDVTAALTPKYLSSGNENAEPVPDNGVIQGQNYFNCSSLNPNSGYQCTDDSARSVFAVESGKRYRLRLVNTGAFTSFQVSVDNHTLQVIEADGTVVDPLPIHRLEIAVAERYSVVLTANQSASTNYWLRGQMNTKCYAASNPVLDPMVLALVTYKNTTDAPTASADWADALDDICQDLNNTLLTPIDVQQAPPADTLVEVAFSFGIGAYALSRALVNGTTWSPSVNSPTLQQAVAGLRGGANASDIATTGIISKGFSANQFVIGLPSAVRVADVLILNFDDGSHPFHLHGHVFWVMATSDRQYFPWSTELYTQLNSSTANDRTANPMRRDTITLPAFSWALIRFRNDNPGMWALHCHNVWHMEAGLMAQLLTQEEKVAQWTVPPDVVGLCQA